MKKVFVLFLLSAVFSLVAPGCASSDSENYQIKNDYTPVGPPYAPGYPAATGGVAGIIIPNATNAPHPGGYDY